MCIGTEVETFLHECGMNSLTFLSEPEIYGMFQKVHMKREVNFIAIHRAQL